MLVFPVVRLVRLRVSHHLNHAPFPHPAHRTGRAQFRHAALGLNAHTILVCNAACSLPTFSGGTRLTSLSRPSASSTLGCELRPLRSTQLPRFFATTSLSATPDTARPDPRGLPVDGHTPSPWGASRVVLDLRGQTCHRNYPGGLSGSCRFSNDKRRRFPHRQRPSPTNFQVGAHNELFEDCSTFTRVTACLLAGPPSGPCVSKAPHELPRSVRCVGRLRGGCFWLECWTIPPISPGPKRRESMPEDLFSQRYAWPQACRAMATASIHSPIVWAAD